MIASAEGTAQADDPYSQGFGNTPIQDLSAHPGTSHTFTQTDGKQNTTSAAGAYQFIKPTWDDAQKTLNLPDFGPKSQDLAALLLMHRNGSLDDVLNGDYSSAVQKDGKTWASLPSSQYAQPKRSQQFVDQALGQGSSGGLISSANAAPAPGASSGDLSTVPAPKLLDAYQRASSAQDTEAMQQISDALTPRLQQGLQAAQDHNDPDAVNQIQGMLGQIGGKSGAPQAPGQSGNPDGMGPPVSAKAPSTLEALGNAVMHPVDTASALVDAGKNFVTNTIPAAAQQAVNDPSTIGPAIYKGIDKATLGLPHAASAALSSLVNGGSYADAYLRQQDVLNKGGALGDVAGAAGTLGLAAITGGAGAVAADAIPTASTGARVLAGAAGGSAAGATNYLTHTGGGPIDGSELATQSGLGALAGTLAPAFTEATAAQKAATDVRSDVKYVKAAGGDQNLAAMQAEVTKDLGSLANRTAQGDTALGPADANALARSYTQGVANDIRQLPKSDDNQALLRALDSPRGLNDDQINALRGTPQGDAAADAITKHQLTLSMTAPTPANSGGIASTLRMAVDNGGLGAVGHAISPGLGFVLDSKPVRTAALNLLGGRENRTGNISALVKGAENANGFLTRNGGSQATQSANALAQQAARAAQARQAVAQAAQAAAGNRQGVNQFQRGLGAAAAARQAAAQGQAQGQQMFQAGQQAAMQSRTQNAAAQAQAVQQARSQFGNAMQGGAQLRQQAQQAAAPVQAELVAQQKAAQAVQAAKAKEALKTTEAQRAALADQQASDPTYLLGMSNRFGPPRNPQEMSEFSKVMRQQAQAAEMGPQAPTQQAQAVHAVQSRQAAQAQEAAHNVAQGNFSGLDINKPQVQALLAYVDHPDLPTVQKTLSSLAAQDPETGQKIAQLLTPGAKNLSKQDFYGLQAKLQAIHGAREPAAAVTSAAPAAAPALTQATGDVQNPLAYKAGIAARQVAQKNALTAAHDPEVKKLITKMSTTSKAADRAELFNDFMKGKSTSQQIEAKRIAEPLVTYGK